MLDTNDNDIPTHCPTCSNELELHPIRGCWSCFLHGDYIFDNGTWVWNPLDSSPFTIQWA